MCSARRGKVILGYTETELCRRGSGYQFVHAADMMHCAEKHVRSECQGEQPGGVHGGDAGAALIELLLLGRLSGVWSGCGEGFLGDTCTGSWSPCTGTPRSRTASRAGCVLCLLPRQRGCKGMLGVVQHAWCT